MYMYMYIYINMSMYIHGSHQNVTRAGRGVGNMGKQINCEISETN